MCLCVQAMTSIPQDILLQVISILLKVRIVVCEEDDDPNNLTSESLISLFTNYKNKKLRVNINVPMKTEMKVCICSQLWLFTDTAKWMLAVTANRLSALTANCLSAVTANWHKYDY